jgi:ABC-2 type transport system ATP-binding protein
MSTSEIIKPSAAPGMQSAQEPVIKVDGVSRWFGNVVSVSDVSFEVYPGITGLLGPNGAGKTTLLRMITGLARTSEGEVTVFGESVRNNPDIYRRIGVMAEHEAVYDFLTGREFVTFAANIRAVANPAEAAAMAIEEVGLSFAADRKMGGYSRGMKQRMRLAATIVHDPELLILDEPLNGADPRQRVHFQNLLRNLADRGRTIFISSHILEEVEALAERVLLIVNGKLAASGDYRSIRAALNERPYHVRVICSDPRLLASGLVRLEEVEAVNVDPDGALIIQSRNVLAFQMALPKVALDTSVRLLRVEPLDDSLESVFSYLVGH